jgi:hypothetical protein
MRFPFVFPSLPLRYLFDRKRRNSEGKTNRKQRRQAAVNLLTIKKTTTSLVMVFFM